MKKKIKAAMHLFFLETDAHNFFAVEFNKTQYGPSMLTYARKNKHGVIFVNGRFAKN